MARDCALFCHGSGAPEDCAWHRSACLRHSFRWNCPEHGTRSWARLQGICQQVARTGRQESFECSEGSRTGGGGPLAPFIADATLSRLYTALHVWSAPRSPFKMYLEASDGNEGGEWATGIFVP